MRGTMSQLSFVPGADPFPECGVGRPFQAAGEGRFPAPRRSTWGDASMGTRGSKAPLTGSLERPPYMLPIRAIDERVGFCNCVAAFARDNEMGWRIRRLRARSGVNAALPGR
jgi:hypothetical protein